MGSTAYQVVGFKEIPIRVADKVTVNGKPYSGATKQDLLRAFVAKLLGPDAPKWAFPLPGKINGVLDILINDGNIDAAKLNGPALLVFDAAVWVMADPANAQAKAVYAHYQTKMEQRVLSAASIDSALRIVITSGTVAKKDHKNEFVGILKNHVPDMQLRVELAGLHGKLRRIDEPQALTARDLK